MGTLITQTPPSSPYDYSPHVLANSPRRIYRGILVMLAGLFHPPFSPLKITPGLTFQLNPPSVTELNLSWEETWWCFPCLFCAIKRVIPVQVCIKGIKSLLVCQGEGEMKLWEKFWRFWREWWTFVSSKSAASLNDNYFLPPILFLFSICEGHCN